MVNSASTPQQDSQAGAGRYARRRITPEEHRQFVHHANGLLLTTAKAAWHMTKFLARVAIRIPGWFVRANRADRANKRPEQKVHSDVNNSAS